MEAFSASLRRQGVAGGCRLACSRQVSHVALSRGPMVTRLARRLGSTPSIRRSPICSGLLRAILSAWTKGSTTRMKELQRRAHRASVCRRVNVPRRRWVPDIALARESVGLMLDVCAASAFLKREVMQASGFGAHLGDHVLGDLGERLWVPIWSDDRPESAHFPVDGLLTGELLFHALSLHRREKMSAPLQRIKRKERVIHSEQKW